MLFSKIECWEYLVGLLTELDDDGEVFLHGDGNDVD